MNASIQDTAADLVQVEHQDHATLVTLNRPQKMNALSASLVDALIAAVDDAHAHGSDLIVMRGAGRNFSAGFDFGGYEEQSEGDLLLRFVRIEQLLQKVATSPAVTLALAHGKNFGAGVDLFGACALRVAAPDATFRMPGLKFGLVLGTRRYAEIVGKQVARDVLTQTRTFGAEEAQLQGFVTELAGPADHDACIARALEAARALAAPVRAQLHQTLAPTTLDADLASLVRSAAEPGLKQRIRAYLGA
ncbi:enoyl-CoA hydratase/isomerase family protein [Achromobacter aloeverae]|uniref:Enoyl-CoA hydratase/isomerase family protein n=1 Tax=Achromobacter aloeverae TaxID=1750518 RepID=A0A4Q1HMD1_9BURK|nr:enoyl-CoA hydratase/isomerase family protein [Achromobacter aloeverae]RXN91538.1 enoyl-CoA hydratase/isomerase family protein [Achromobacter aloeverae]